MKYLIISDIHGSSKYLKLVLEQVKDYDKIIILGDILYHGPRNKLPEGHNPMEIIEILNNLKDKIIAIKGNCEAKIDLELLDFEIAEKLWMNIDEKNIFLTHGDEYNKDRIPCKRRKYTIIHGHTHINQVIEVNNKVKVFNVGSLSLPKDNHYSYAIIENEILTSYDLLTKDKIIEINI